MPLVGVLTNKIDPRKILAFGFTLGAATMYSLAGLNLNAGYWDIFWPQVFQGMALSCMFIPLMAASMARIKKENMGNATSIFNLMRNIGGSFGIAVMTTFLVRRNQFHQSRLVENITLGNIGTRQALDGLKQWFQLHGTDPYTAGQRAVAALYGMVLRQAAMLSFVEAFWILTLMFISMIPFLLILRRPVARKMRVTVAQTRPELKPAAEKVPVLLEH
jgi:DHA2 family multidrug resistance protein